MNAQPTSIPEVLVLEPWVHGDHRGYFYESYNRARFAGIVGDDPEFVQDNHSRSRKGVLRGLHCQLPPRAQGKLVRAIAGRVFDVAVDIRRSSPTFARWVGVELSAENRRELWVPEGFAHGFLALSGDAEVLYKTTAYYSAEHDRGIRWNDPDVGVEWPITGTPILSDKDAAAPLLGEADLFD